MNDCFFKTSFDLNGCFLAYALLTNTHTYKLPMT